MAEERIMDQGTDPPPNPLGGLRPEDIVAQWSVRGLDRIDDAELLAAACKLLTVPHLEKPDSFALHAPLEVMARAELLGSISPSIREQARQRIADIACTWATSGTPMADQDPSGIANPLGALAGALGDGDELTVDRAFVALCARRSQDEVIGDLVDLVIPHLGGAAHGAIFLELLPRFRPAGINPALMGRTLLGDLARHCDWAIRWVDRPRPPRAAGAAGGSLSERLRSPKVDGQPANDFIYPTMALVDESGAAGELLADVTIGMAVADARRDLLRTAARSMVQDDPTHAPYGWSHCFTMPQATLAVADRATDPQRAVDVAATYVLGFRATQSSTAIDADLVPDRPRVVDPHEVVGLEPHTAAALAWHADADDRATVVQRLVDHAAIHPDAHLAKYTLACLDACRDDPEATPLYHAAAATLAAWWHQHDQPTA